MDEIRGGAIEKGVFWFVGGLVALLLGGIGGWFAGAFLFKNVYVMVATAIGSAFIGNRAFAVWYGVMIRAKKSPVLTVLLFLIMVAALSLGLILFMKDVRW